MNKIWKAVGLAAISAAMLVGAPVAAQAGSHWSAKKCGAQASKWIQSHPGATSQQALKYERKQHKNHGCAIGG